MRTMGPDFGALNQFMSSCRGAVPLGILFMSCNQDDNKLSGTCMLGAAPASPVPRRRAKTGPKRRVPAALGDPHSRRASGHSTAPASPRPSRMAPRQRTARGGQCWSLRPLWRLPSAGCSTRGRPRRSRRSTPLTGGAWRRAKPLPFRCLADQRLFGCETGVRRGPGNMMPASYRAVTDVQLRSSLY